MPTGYTHKLMEEGLTFPAFVMSCARAFGACVTMRDDEPDLPIPDKFEPSDYNRRALKKARARLSSLNAMTRPRRVTFGKKQKKEALKQYRAMLLSEATQNARLIKMQKEVTAWQPPTPEHSELKQFMLNQLEISMHDTSYAKREIAEVSKKAPLAFYSQAVASAQRDIEYHAEEDAAEIERTNRRNEWIAKLRASLAA